MENERYPTIGGWGKKDKPGGLCVICLEPDSDCVVDLMLGWDKTNDQAILKPYPIHRNCYMSTLPKDILAAMVNRHKVDGEPMTKKEYSQSMANFCPSCKSKNILQSEPHGLTLYANNKIALRHMYCTHCRLHFTIDFYLGGYTIVGY